MINDRQITITVGTSRKSTQWLPQRLLLSELYAKLQTPARSMETLAEYLAMAKGRQDDLKDVGGFVAGTLNGKRRKAGNVTGRDVITLDLDNIPAGGTADVLRRLEGLTCGYCVYSTRKHILAVRPDYSNVCRDDRDGRRHADRHSKRRKSLAWPDGAFQADRGSTRSCR